MERPQRKHPRLKEYDYSLPGFYFVTIHAEQGIPAMSTIHSDAQFGDALVRLTALGMVVKKQLFALEWRYPHVKVDKFVIMPNHIHAIFQLCETAESSRRPDLMDVVCAYKSLTTRECNELNQTPGRKMFQTSFYDAVLRSETAYQECWRYIDENPAKWLLRTEDR